MPKPFWASAALALALAGAGAGCGPGAADTEGDATLAVYVSLPLRGSDGADGRDAADGARMALADAGGRAAGLEVRATYLDDTAGTPRGARWSPAVAAANARRATQDSTAIAYLGELSSGATRASLPVTNAGRVLQVSPGAGASDLVARPGGGEELPPTQPGASRTFGRVIPSDRVQGEAAAVWAAALGVRTVSVEGDTGAYGATVSRGFEDALDGPALVRRSDQLVFYAGLPDAQPLAGAGGPARLMVTDAALAPGVAEPSGTLATSAAQAPTQLPPLGRRFAGAFERQQGRAPGRYAAYGYEAMAAILDSVERAGDPTDRESVVDAFFATTDRDSVIGAYSITPLGETTLDRLSGYRIGRAGAEPAIALRTGP